MESFVVAVMIEDVSVWNLRFWDGGGENYGGGGKWGGKEKLDGGNVHVLLRLVGSGVKEMEHGRLQEGGE